MLNGSMHHTHHSLPRCRQATTTNPKPQGLLNGCTTGVSLRHDAVEQPQPTPRLLPQKSASLCSWARHTQEELRDKTHTVPLPAAPDKFTVYVCWSTRAPSAGGISLTRCRGKLDKRRCKQGGTATDPRQTNKLLAVTINTEGQHKLSAGR